MKAGAFRRTATTAIIACLAIILAIWYFEVRTPPIPPRTLRIGFENVPPLQIRTANEPSGLAVETVNEAARRAGIKLQWIDTGVSSDESFRRQQVDLWPLMADMPYRRHLVHITRPWLHTSLNLLLRPGTARPPNTFTGSIAVFRMPLLVRLAHTEFPAARVVELAETRQVVQAVCLGTVDGGMLEDRATLAELREKPPECASIALRVERLPELRIPLGVGSTFEAAGAADKLRGEITKLFREGTLGATMAKYSYYGLDDAWSTYALMEASEHTRWMAWGAALFSIVLALAVWQAASLRQRKRSEAELRASEERFRAIFHQAAVGDAQVTLDGEVTLVNDRYCEVLGYTREELLGKQLVEHIHPEDRPAVLAHRQCLLEGGPSPYSMEIRSVRAGGAIAWVKLHESLVRHAEGGAQYSIAVVEDITERRQAELALQESERRFRNMADAAPIMIWVAGPDQRCTFFSQGWLGFTGVSMEQALGDGWVQSIHPDSREQCERNFTGAFATHSSFQTECRLRRADGEYRWVLATGAPRFGIDGAFAGYIGSCTDITDIKGAQEKALARQKLEGLGVLAGGIAHDFNNLLGSILATSELVLSELPAGSQAREGIAAIKSVADRAAEIVRQMMAYSGQEDTVFEPLDLSDLVREMLQLLQVSIAKNAQLTVDLPANLPAIRANGPQIRQVVLNLITNASEALGEREGNITVALQHVQPKPRWPVNGPLEIGDTDHVRLTVSDTGTGMTDEIRAKIFDPFFTTKFAGRGLGLAAVRGIIRDHHGAINVLSLPGQGSRFEILLPCTNQPASTAPRRAAPAPAVKEAVGATVLVVEDENHLRLAVAKMLRKQGFSVVEASDGHSGVAMFRAQSQEIDVVLLDLTLPGRTGREVFEEMRRMRPDVKVILTTAYSRETALQTIGDQESWRYLRKPYRIGEVTDLLRNISSTM